MIKDYIKKNKASLIICIVCASAIAAAVYMWIIKTPHISAAGMIVGLLCAALFVALGFKFCPLLVNAWKGKEEMPMIGEKPSKKELLCVFLFFILADIAIILLGWLLQAMAGRAASFESSLNVWGWLDSQHYIDIAKDWYLSSGEHDRLVQLVFFPAYPLLIKLFNYVIGNYLISGMAVSALCFAGAGTIIYRLAYMDLGKEGTRRAIKYMLIIPPVFFFAAPMSESLFLLLCAAGIMFAREKKWALACIMGALASFTRSLGVVMFAPIAFEMIADIVKDKGEKKKLLKLLYLLIIPLGFAAYLYINYSVAGDPFKFLEYQKEHWNQSFGYFFNTAAYQTDYLISCLNKGDIKTAIGLWAPGLISIFSSLAIFIASAKKIRASYTAYFIAYFFIAISATWLLSAPRYLSALFPLPIALAKIGENKKADIAISALMIIFMIIYFYAFVMRWQVW